MHSCLERIHTQLLKSNLLSNMEGYMNQYIQNEYIAFGFISTCKGLSNSGSLFGIPLICRRGTILFM